MYRILRNKLSSYIIAHPRLLVFVSCSGFEPPWMRLIWATTSSKNNFSIKKTCFYSPEIGKPPLFSFEKISSPSTVTSKLRDRPTLRVTSTPFDPFLMSWLQVISNNIWENLQKSIGQPCRRTLTRHNTLYELSCLKFTFWEFSNKLIIFVHLATELTEILKSSTQRGLLGFTIECHWL